MTCCNQLLDRIISSRDWEVSVHWKQRRYDYMVPDMIWSVHTRRTIASYHTVLKSPWIAAENLQDTKFHSLSSHHRSALKIFCTAWARPSKSWSHNWRLRLPKELKEGLTLGVVPILDPNCRALPLLLYHCWIVRLNEVLKWAAWLHKALTRYLCNVSTCRESGSETSPQVLASHPPTFRVIWFPSLWSIPLLFGR